MALLNFRKKTNHDSAPSNLAHIADLLAGYSIEVMPRTAAKITDFRAILPPGTRVYIAHIEGTSIDDMVETARRIRAQGFPVMPHFPARIINDTATLSDWIARYQGEADVDQALVLAGGVDRPHGAFHSSMQLLETGAFDRAGFKRLHVAGHPEGNKDIDPDGGSRNVEDALAWKQQFSERTDARTALVTQFAFEAKPIITWAQALSDAGITLPIHLGIAGPAKLQTLIKFAIACGVGPSFRVLQKRAKDLSKLLQPFEPTDLVSEIAAHKSAHPESNLAQLHLFPLGGIDKSASWAAEMGAQSDSTSELTGS